MRRSFDEFFVQLFDDVQQMEFGLGLLSHPQSLPDGFETAVGKVGARQDDFRGRAMLVFDDPDG